MSADGDITKPIRTLGPRRTRPKVGGGLHRTLDEELECSDMHGQDDWPCNGDMGGQEVRLW